MIFTAICTFGFLFVCFALPFALRVEAKRRKDRRRAGGAEWSLREQPQRRESAWWAKDSSYSYPNTDPEYLDALDHEEHDPHHFPSPFPPQQSGDES